jgi:hypothetical protein
VSIVMSLIVRVFKVLRVLSRYDIKYLVLVLKSWFSRIGNGVIDKGSLIVEGTLRLNY